MAAGIATFALEQKVGFAANVDELITPRLPVHLRQPLRDMELAIRDHRLFEALVCIMKIWAA
jgi:hypothetical protein